MAGRLSALLLGRAGSLPGRITAIAMLPALALAVLVGGLAIYLRQGDLEAGLQQRGLLLARQLASAADYGVFSGNRTALQALADSVAREQSVVLVRIRDREGRVLAQASPIGNATAGAAPAAPLRSATDRDLDRGGLPAGLPVAPDIASFRDVIRSPRIAIDDLDAGNRPGALETSGDTNGFAEVQLSREQILGEARRFAFAVTGILAVVLLITGLVARRMSRRLSRPVVDAAMAVERIGRGETGVRLEPSPIRVLDLLGRGVNEMSSRLETSMQQLETRVQEATGQLQIKMDEAERANRAKSRFLAAASHDLRQPMHALGMFIAALQQMPASPMQRELQGQIERAAAAMGDLLDSLLDISRLDAGVIEKRVAPLPLSAVFERVRDEFTGPARAKGLDLVVRKTGRWVLSDRILLERILVNLVSNAIRYTDQGTVLVAARVWGAQRDQLRIDVRDSGSGIPAKAQEVIFQEFVQLANPERDRSKGLGLGLSIVRRLVTLLDHRLELRSAVGQGSTFSVVVPLAGLVSAPEPAEHARETADDLAVHANAEPLPDVHVPPAHSGPVPRGTRAARFLVIDDDPMVREGLGQLLRSWGGEVTLEPGDVGLPARVAAGPMPDAVLCDLRLAEGMDGVRLLTAIRQATGRPLKAVVITGDTDPERVTMAAQGGDPVLHKPVRPAQLRALLRSLLARR